MWLFPNSVDCFLLPPHSPSFPKLFLPKKPFLFIAGSALPYPILYFVIYTACHFGEKIASFSQHRRAYNQICVQLQLYTDKIELKKILEFYFLNSDRMDVDKRTIKVGAAVPATWGNIAGRTLGRIRGRRKALSKLSKYFLVMVKILNCKSLPQLLPPSLPQLQVKMRFSR